MRHGVPHKAHAAQHQEHADWPRAYGKREHSGKRAPHELEIRKGGYKEVAQHAR
jgi:hypothetical protein